MKQMTIKKIIIFGIIIVGFAVIVYFISNAFASKCDANFRYDKEQKKCIRICSQGQKYYKETDQCLSCPPDQKMISGVCQKDCSKEGVNEDNCGNNCYNKNNFTCLPGNKLCSNSQVTYKYTCCNSNETYAIAPYPVFFPKLITDVKDVKELISLINETLPLITPSISQSTLNNSSNILEAAKITQIKQLQDLSEDDWKLLNLPKNMDIFMRTLFFRKICTKCPENRDMCNNVCCGEDQSCIENKCCHKSNLHQNKCCSNWNKYTKECCEEGQISTTNGCMKKCTYDNISCNLSKDETCLNFDVIDENGNKKGKSVCKTSKCKFDDVNQSIPQNVHGNPVCKLSKNSYEGAPYLACNSAYITDYDKHTISNVSSGKSCTEGDCWNNNKTLGVMDVNFSNDVCTSTLSCKHSKVGETSCDKCPSGIPDDQCCKLKTGEFNGFVCADGTVCDESGALCVQDWWIGNNGTDTEFKCIRAPLGHVIDPTKAWRTKAECEDFWCDDSDKTKNKCCASGWRYIKGKCLQLPPNSHYNITQPSGLARECKPNIKGICGPSYKTNCIKKSMFESDSAWCDNIPINPDNSKLTIPDGGIPPNLDNFKYCRCKIDDTNKTPNKWVNTNDPFTQSQWSPKDGWPTCDPNKTNGDRNIC